MTGAELKTIRESLGLSVKWLAEKAGVSHRSASYWESCTFSVPDDVAQMINALDAGIDSMVTQAINVIDDQIKGQGELPEKVVLLRYRTDEDLWQFRSDMAGLPVTYHAAMLARLRSAVISLKVPCFVYWLDPDDYLAWLGTRKDSEAMRSAWAVANC